MSDKLQGLRVVMAVSYDGFVARGPTDDMSWTGKADKEVFRMLTSVGGTVGVGRVTARLMPEKLTGRTLVSLSTQPLFGMDLGQFVFKYPGAWLAGGQTVVMAALSMETVDEVHLCRNVQELGRGVLDRVSPFLDKRQVAGSWQLTLRTRLAVGGVTVETWRRVRP